MENSRGSSKIVWTIRGAFKSTQNYLIQIILKRGKRKFKVKMHSEIIRWYFIHTEEIPRKIVN